MVLLCFFGFILLSGCSGRKSTAYKNISNEKDIVIEPEKSDPEENNSNDGKEELTVTQSSVAQDDEEITIDKSENPPEILHFVDVFGEQYEVEINPLIPKHNYVSGNFQRDGDKLYYNDDYYTSRLGIDVSYHQGDIDWNSVAEDGYEFAILRIGFRGYGKEGKINKDSKFEEYYNAAKEAGLDVGVYFFSQAISDDEALEEADFVLDVLDGRELDLPVTYDPESILDAEARTDDVSREQFTRNTELFCEKIRNGGYEPMIYSNMLWEAYNFDLTKFEGITIWYADYEPYPQTPYRFDFFQYYNEARVKGISGVCDVDIQFIKN